MASALERTVEAIEELRRDVRFGELLERWRSGSRVDPYALADLATFRGILGRMLKRGLRRAFYSGDYHQIQRREVALAERIARLEATHHRTWTEPADSPETVAAFRQLGGLTLEVAAILDVELLEELAGSRAVKDLRTAVMSEQSKARRKPLAPELEPLVPLLAGEDLRTFLSLLLGSVLKRASLARRGAPQPASAPATAVKPHAVEEPVTPLGAAAEPVRAAGEELLPDIEELAAGLDFDEPPAAPAPAPASRSEPVPAPRAITQSGTFHVGALASPERRREVLTRLHEILTTLQSPSNPHWSSFRMLQRLLERHSSVPPSIAQGAHPFVYEVLNELVPQLEVAASIAAVPPEARPRLVECCLAITDDQLTPVQMVDEVPANLSRLTRLLEALTAATVAQLRSL